MRRLRFSEFEGGQTDSPSIRLSNCRRFSHGRASKLHHVSIEFTKLPIYTGSPVAVLTYARPDWLGSSRLVTSTTRTMVSDNAYAPFGEQYSATGSSFYDFTGQQQWTISAIPAGLDDFLFRRYHPVQGRWISPDPAG